MNPAQLWLGNAMLRAVEASRPEEYRLVYDELALPLLSWAWRAFIRVFEVDHPDTQAQKKKAIVRTLGTLPPHVAFVPVDFQAQALGDVMAEAGFRKGGRTFFLRAGVTQYIGAETVWRKRSEHRSTALGTRSPWAGR